MGAVKEQVASDKATPDVLSDEKQLLYDYWLANVSREASYIGRKEVLTGKAKFGIFGDGKEAAQLAMAKVFEPGDFRSGYYRDQTFMMAIDQLNLEQFFAQMYADPNPEHDPMTAGRQMNSHFATQSLDSEGNWRNLTEIKNSAADVSPTGSQMPRLVGLGYASKLYSELEELKQDNKFSNNGREVAFGTIGNATVAEGMFWEAVNAIGLLQVPVTISIWDDEYGISVPNKYQITKSNISDILEGFAYDEESGQGFYLYSAKGWDFPQLVRMYEEGVYMAREHHVPVVFHIQEMTQPQGHSTSGSHERYKTEERLEWERQMDCINQMRQWMLNQGLATQEKLDELESDARQVAKDAKNKAYKAYQDPIKAELKEAADEINKLATASAHQEELQTVEKNLRQSMVVNRKAIMKAIHDALRVTCREATQQREALVQWYSSKQDENRERYNSHLRSQSDQNLSNIQGVAPAYPADGGETVNGYEILNHFFDQVLSRDPRVFAIGEDLGKIGGVNQGMAGLQKNMVNCG
jgi:Pyruvate/2-oxoglutarate dehydrogenase complex, dehydrogenase (E1) component, eukaryotic type, alpha subunit